MDIGIDNLMTVQVANQPPRFGDLHRACHSGLIRSTQVQPGWGAIQGRARHVRSHRLDKEPDLLATTEGKERRDLIGNQEADRRATRGLDQHPLLDGIILRIDQMAHKVARLVAELASNILPIYPELGRHSRRRQQERGSLAEVLAGSELHSDTAAPPTLPPKVSLRTLSRPQPPTSRHRA